MQDATIRHGHIKLVNFLIWPSELEEIILIVSHIIIYFLHGSSGFRVIIRKSEIPWGFIYFVPTSLWFIFNCGYFSLNQHPSDAAPACISNYRIAVLKNKKLAHP